MVLRWFSGANSPPQDCWRRLDRVRIRWALGEESGELATADLHERFQQCLAKAWPQIENTQWKKQILNDSNRSGPRCMLIVKAFQDNGGGRGELNIVGFKRDIETYAAVDSFMPHNEQADAFEARYPDKKPASVKSHTTTEPPAAPPPAQEAQPTAVRASDLLKKLPQPARKPPPPPSAPPPAEPPAPPPPKQFANKKPTADMMRYALDRRVGGGDSLEHDFHDSLRELKEHIPTSVAHNALRHMIEFQPLMQAALVRTWRGHPEADRVRLFMADLAGIQANLSNSKMIQDVRQAVADFMHEAPPVPAVRGKRHNPVHPYVNRDMMRYALNEKRGNLDVMSLSAQFNREFDAARQLVTGNNFMDDAILSHENDPHVKVMLVHHYHQSPRKFGQDSFMSGLPSVGLQLPELGKREAFRRKVDDNVASFIAVHPQRADNGLNRP